MGNCCCFCFGKNADTEDVITPDADTLRRQMAEAADQRQQAQQSKGIKNPDNVKRMEQKAANAEQLEREYAIAAKNRPVLRWKRD